MTDSLEASSWYLGPAWVGEAQWQIWHGKVSSEALVEESWTQKRLLIAIGDKREGLIMISRSNTEQRGY